MVTEMKKLSILLAAAILGGCSGGNGSATNNNANPPASPPGKSASAAADDLKGYAAIQAVFNANCTKCHSGAQARQGIDLSSYEGAIKGGNEGVVIKPGDPAGSKMIMALHGQNGVKQMPPRNPLPPETIAKIEAWIKDGAKKT